MGLEPECIVQVKLLFKVIHGPTLCLYLTLRWKVKGGSAAKDIFFKIGPAVDSIIACATCDIFSSPKSFSMFPEAQVLFKIRKNQKFLFLCLRSSQHHPYMS